MKVFNSKLEDFKVGEIKEPRNIAEVHTATFLYDIHGNIKEH